MVGEHRAVGGNGITRRTGHIPTDLGVADIRGIPTDAVGQQKIVTPRQGHQHLGKTRVHAVGHHGTSLREQSIKVRRPERRHAIFHHQLMLLV
ncbi:hypothetical protein D3C79_833030 [compost metagenome]